MPILYPVQIHPTHGKLYHENQINCGILKTVYSGFLLNWVLPIDGPDSEFHFSLNLKKLEVTEPWLGSGTLLHREESSSQELEAPSEGLV